MSQQDVFVFERSMGLSAFFVVLAALREEGNLKIVVVGPCFDLQEDTACVKPGVRDRRDQ
jgi:hypothetical protein